MGDVRRSASETDAFSPIVWIFEYDDNRSQQYMQTTFLAQLSYRHVYYTMPVLTIPPRSDKGHFLAAACVLSPWFYMSNDPTRWRQLPSWLRVSGCRIPRQDAWTLPLDRTPANALRRPYEHLIRVAIEFARRRVIVASDTGNRVSPALADVAKAKGIEIIEVNLDRLPRIDVEALRDFRFAPRLVEDIE
jgi:hypothetical protein